jgi:hypothetical protein
MLFDPPAHLLRYSPDIEELEKGEAETEQGLIKQILKISETTFKDSGHAMRGVHAKSHGIVEGKLIVPAGLPPVLAQGLFAKPGEYDVILRFSTSPGDILDDSVSTPRGLALKVFGVEGARLPGAEGADTQDFIFVNGKAFGTPNAKAFLGNLTLLAGTTDKIGGLKKVLSAALQGAESLVEATGNKSPTLASLGGHPETNILGESFFSQVPIRYGDYVAKVGLKPTASSLTALTNKPVDMKGRPDALRETVKDYFASQGGEWEFVAQLCDGQDDMPIEDAHKPWPEDKSPYIPVARLVVAPQTSWDEAKATRINDSLVFSPWHGIVEHQPLGSIMRVRKAVYEASAQFRLSHNGCPMHEPRNLGDVGA